MYNHSSKEELVPNTNSFAFPDPKQVKRTHSVIYNTCCILDIDIINKPQGTRDSPYTLLIAKVRLLGERSGCHGLRVIQ